MKRAFFQGFPAITLALLVGGCGPKPAPEMYVGPIAPVQTVVERLNANAAATGSLSATGGFRARLLDGDRFITASGDVSLVHAKPEKLRLRAKWLGDEVFDAGTDGREWYFQQERPSRILWRGPVGSGAPEGVPLPPDELATVFGFGLLSTDLLDDPAPVQTFDAEADRYRLTWVTYDDVKLSATRAAWYDRETLRPVRVELYADDGRPTLIAELSGHVLVDGGGEVATFYDLVLPAADAEGNDVTQQMEIRLDDVRLRRDGKPDRRSFRRPADKNADRVIEFGDFGQVVGDSAGPERRRE